METRVNTRCELHASRLSSCDLVTRYGSKQPSLNRVKAAASTARPCLPKTPVAHYDFLDPASPHTTINKPSASLRMHLAQKRGASPMSLFFTLKSQTPLPLLLFLLSIQGSISPSLLVLLLLSEQPNEAEGQRSARAILPHYARIHSLSHKQPGTGKQNSPLSVCTSLPSVHGCWQHHWEKKFPALHAYVLEFTCMCLTRFPLPLPRRFHSTSFISTIKIFALHHYVSAEHVQLDVNKQAGACCCLFKDGSNTAHM